LILASCFSATQHVDFSTNL